MKGIDFRSRERYSDALAELADRLGINNVSDDNRFLDESLFRMSNEKRRELFGQILNERVELAKYDVKSTHSTIDAYRRRDYHFDLPGKTFIDARNLSHYVASLLPYHDKFADAADAEPFVISVCGFPGLGKTTFSRELLLTVSREHKKKCSIVEFEKWMKNRSERWDGVDNVISGFDSGAFYYDDLTVAVRKLCGGRSIEQPVRSDGERTSLTRRIQPAPVLILDGVLSFFNEFSHLSDLHVYFDADLATRYLLSALKDSFVRQYDSQRWESKFYIHESTYPRFIQLLRNRAALIIMTTPFHNYQCYSLHEKGQWLLNKRMHRTR